MFWIKVLIAVVVIVGWIVGNLKERQKAAEKPVPPPLPPVGPELPATAGKADDLQEFLKQLRRRTGESEPQKVAEPLPAVLIEESPRIERAWIEPTPVVSVPKAKKRNRSESAPRMPRLRVEITPPPTGPAPYLAPAASDLPMAAGRGKANPAAFREAVRLLKSPTGLKTAFVLREILSEPLSKRRHSR